MKHIKLFENKENNILKPLFELKRVGVEATALGKMKDGANLISNYLENNKNEIRNALDFYTSWTMSQHGGFTRQISVTDLLYPFFIKYSKEIEEGLFSKEYAKDSDLDIPSDAEDMLSSDDFELDI
tara:strand:- start:7148 stop:7525 length:378 start_codon:yes stop_codon:yes gene_type:complete